MFVFVIILGTSMGTCNFGSFKSIMEGHYALLGPCLFGGILLVRPLHGWVLPSV